MKKLPVEYVNTRRKYILFNNDCGVSDMARWGHIYEPYIFEYIQNNIDIKGKNIIDVGANFGFHSLEFADLVDTGNVYSFEPQKLVYYQLCGNILLNGFNNITAFNIALSDEFSLAKIENPDYYSESKINIGDSHLNAFINNGYNEVDVKPLDSYNFENVAVIKIDVQGHEPKVLDGAIETIKKNRPVLFIEVEPAQLEIYGWKESDVFDRLTKLNYTYRKVQDSEHLLDYVAVPTDKYLNFFDAVYYINLDDRVDRRELFEKRSKLHDINAVRFPGIVPSENQYKQIINEFDERRKYKVGCTLSHQGIVKEAKEKGHKNVLIFEDDCVFMEDFKNYAQLCVNELKDLEWDIMYFGGEPNNYCEGRVSKNLYKMRSDGGVYCAHAYAVNHTFYDKILNVDANAILTLDNFYVSSPSKKILSAKIIALQDDNTYSDLWGYVTNSSKQTNMIDTWNKFVVGDYLTRPNLEHFYQNIQNWFDYQKLFRDIVQNSSDNQHFVELGVWKGGSTAFMGVEIYNSNKQIIYDAIDCFEPSSEFGDYYEEAIINLKPLTDLNIVNIIKGRSEEVVNNYDDNSIDFCFIDGSHLYEDVIVDIRNWLPKVKINGIFAGHDYDKDGHPGVYRAVGELLGHENIKQLNSCYIYKKNGESNLEKDINSKPKDDLSLSTVNSTSIVNEMKVAKVSFICTTYRRFRCVERIIAQFYAQTYPYKELVIFNTDMEHPLELGFEDDSIIIVNNDIDYQTGTPYENRGQICRDAVTHATGYYFMLADDDDIYLPWHMEQAVDGIIALGTDAWKPEASLFALTEKIQITQNVMEASIIVKMNRIKEIGFRTDITGYEGLSWVMKLVSEKQLDEHNKNYVPSYCFNWSDPYDMGGHKQSSFIGAPNNFENHKLLSTDFATRSLNKYTEEEIKNVYNKYYDFIENNLDKLNMVYYERYAKKYTKKSTKQKKIKFIVPLPDSSYYLWQILVQINNFRRLGYEIDAHYPVCIFNNNPSEILKQLSNSTNIKAHFHLYYDNREDKSYSASMKPWLMAQYFKEFPEEKDNIYIYLDPDVIFLDKMNFSKFIDDDIWYESDTCSYLDSRYIKSKGEQLFYEMCDIVGIPYEVVLSNDKNCGGAQYITKNNTFEFWNEVEKTSVPLYKHMVDTAVKYKPEGDPYPIQAWTSEMWTTNWCLWKNGITTKCVPELDFHWADHKMKELKHTIFHNAGVVKEDDINFCKTTYQKSPFRKDIKISKDSISYKYLLEVKETEINFPELIDIFIG